MTNEEFSPGTACHKSLLTPPVPRTSKQLLNWFLMALIIVGGIELGSIAIEYLENIIARKKNPYVEAINPVPAFEIKDIGGIKCVVRSGNHPLMNPELRPFTLERPKNGLRFFIVGGSAAAGWPYHIGNTNISALLERKLRLLFPGRQVEVINAAAGTYASHRVELILEEVVHYNPTAVIVYNGNNEFLESLVYRPMTPPEPWDRSATLRLAYRIFLPKPKIDVKNFSINAQVPNTLAFAFSRASLYRDDPRQFDLLLKHYRYNIDDMIKAGDLTHVPLLFTTCPVNLKNWTPNVSRHRKGLTPEEKQKWRTLYREGELAIENKQYNTAIAPLRSALSIDDEYAETHYHLAEALRNTGKYTEAKQEYILALERDAFPFRELPEFQAILREETAKRHIPLIDIIPPLESHTLDGILGLDALVDYVHLTEQSQEIVAHQIVTALFKQGIIQGVSEAEIAKTKIPITNKFYALRDVAAADLNYNMAMVMHQYERIDQLYNEAIATFTRAAKEAPEMAVECQNRILLFKEIQPIVRAYRDLLHDEKFGYLDKYPAGEVDRIYNMYAEMIRQTKTPGITVEEFKKQIPHQPFHDN